MSSLTTDVIEQIIELREAGYSIREVASEVGVPKSTVERVLKSDSPVPMSNATPIPFVVNNPPIGESANRTDQVRLREREIALREKEIELEKVRIESETKMTDRLEVAKAGRLEARKQVLADKFNRLLREFNDNCQDSTWEHDEVEDFIERADTLLGKVTALCESVPLDEESLAIWNHLDILIGFMEELLEEQGNRIFGKSAIELDLSDQEQKRFAGFAILDFEDEYVEEEEDSEEEDEEGEDEE